MSSDRIFFKEDGYALFLVLVLITISLLILPSLMSLTISEVSTSRNYQYSIQEYYLIEGAVKLAVTELKGKLEVLYADKGYISNQDLLTMLGSKELQITDTNNDSLIIKYEVQELVDESSKININTASESMLKALNGVGSILAEKIINRRNYASIEELVQVDGIGDIESQSYQDIRDYITVDSDGRININTASWLVLKSLDGINISKAQSIKDNLPFATKEELLDVDGIGQVTYDNLAADVRVDSQTFTVRLKVTIASKGIEKEAQRLVTID